MIVFEDRRIFKRKVEQSNPTNPTGNTNIETNSFDIKKDSIKDSIKEQQNKK